MFSSHSSSHGTEFGQQKPRLREKQRKDVGSCCPLRHKEIAARGLARSQDGKESSYFGLFTNSNTWKTQMTKGSKLFNFRDFSKN